jgi:hypothetical protein
MSITRMDLPTSEMREALSSVAEEEATAEGEPGRTGDEEGEVEPVVPRCCNQ